MKNNNEVLYYWPGFGIVVDIPDHGFYDVQGLEYLILVEKKMDHDTRELERILSVMRITPIPVNSQLDIKMP